MQEIKKGIFFVSGPSCSGYCERKFIEPLIAKLCKDSGDKEYEYTATLIRLYDTDVTPESIYVQDNPDGFWKKQVFLAEKNKISNHNMGGTILYA